MSTTAECKALAMVVEQLVSIRVEHGKIPKDFLENAAARVGKSPRTMLRLVQNLNTDGVVPSPPKSRAITLTKAQTELALKEWFRLAGNVSRTHKALSDHPEFPNMSYRTFLRIVETWDEYLHQAAVGGFGEMMKRQGVFTEKIPYRTYSYGIDHTMLPIRVLANDSNTGWVKPWLTIVLDLYSRTIVSHALYLVSPNTEDVLEVLADSFLIRETEAGLFGGVPARLRSDNGGDFKSGAVQHALFDLGVIQDLTEPYTASQNGRVERTNGSIKKWFAPTQPGYAKGSDTEKEMRVRRAVVPNETLLTLEELNANFTAWVEEFNNSEHPDRHLKPLTRLEVWHGSPEPLKEPKEFELWAAMLRRSPRKLQKYGIEFNKDVWQHPALSELFSHNSGTITVDVRWSKRFPDTIHVFHDGDYLCAAPRSTEMSDQQKAAFGRLRKGQTRKAAELMNGANRDRAADAEEQILNRQVVEDASFDDIVDYVPTGQQPTTVVDDDDLDFEPLANRHKEAS